MRVPDPESTSHPSAGGRAALGRAGEDAAAAVYRRRGFEVVARNWRCRLGEVDLVVRKGGTVVCGGIHMSDIPSFPYALLWGERVLRSVANLTRRDAADFLALAPTVPVHTEVTAFRLEGANVVASIHQYLATAR